MDRAPQGASAMLFWSAPWSGPVERHPALLFSWGAARMTNSFRRRNNLGLNVLNEGRRLRLLAISSLHCPFLLLTTSFLKYWQSAMKPTIGTSLFDARMALDGQQVTIDLI